ncbi:MAG: carboxypeptidase regulatory-like domain-containing protein [Verrucomicrobiota bacterium]|nr:carboxypeptidase regulatory-like domain-containing protein [Verrucomicrobiota bacterium]
MTRLISYCILYVCSVLSAYSFVPYVENGNPLRWNIETGTYHPNLVNPSTKAIRYFIGAETYSTGNRAAELNAIRVSFDQWQSVPGTTLKFEEGGLLPGTLTIDLEDNTNVIFWTKTRFVAGNDMSGRAGFSSILYSVNNEILQADIVLNGFETSWITDFTNTISASRFVEAVVCHEIGHFIGLDHTPVGGATVIDGGGGISTEAGLSVDEIAAARYLYPAPGLSSSLGEIRGTVTKNGAPILGAMVTAEDMNGNVAAGTVTDASGNYALPMLSPGNYNVRVSPLDPASSSKNNSLIRGIDIAFVPYNDADTSFLATDNSNVVVTAGGMATQSFAVTAGLPPFRISSISKPTPFTEADSLNRFAMSVRQGQSNLFVGVSSTTLPSDATLQITGNGISTGPTIYKPNRFAGGIHLLSLQFSVSSNAIPGLRSFVVSRGGDRAYANGYLEILPPVADHNFDGLDDLFQRRYFARFTAPEAASGSDPDGDRFGNGFEFRTGTDPTNPNSFSFLIQQIRISRGSAVVTFKSEAGKQYQLYFKEALAPSDDWAAVGQVKQATGDLTEIVDSGNSSGNRFYKLELLP